MDNEIYYESTSISYKTINQFETMYNLEKKKILNYLKKKIKEEYNIDINGSTEDVTIVKTPSDNTSTYI